MEGKPFALIGVNSDEDKAELKKAMKEENITWRSFWDVNTSGPIATRWAVEGWPTLYLIDQKGVVRQKWVGSPRPAEKMDEEIEKLLKEVEAKK
jgi:hypothetical protein